MTDKPIYDRPGQPTKYNADMQKLAEDYADFGWRDAGHLFPSNMGLALTLEVAEATIDNWGNSDDKPQFLGTLARIKALQHLDLVQRGLTNEFNATITKLMLCNHGRHDKSAQEITGANGGPMEVRERRFLEVHEVDKNGE